jgi:thiamine pyrophosphokinase
MAFRLIGNKRIWSPLKVKDGGADKYAIVLLNHALDHKQTEAKAKFADLWRKGCLKVAVDGGCNWLNTLELERPDFISGDFDSVNPSVLEAYKNRGTEIKPTPDQDATDFTKAVQLVMEHLKQKPGSLNYILAIGSIGGRIDHCLSNLNTLYTLEQETKECPIFLYDVGDYVSWVLSNEAEHTIESNHASRWCSLIPLSGASRVTSTGLKWDLANDEMKFGALISTSNEFDKGKDEVTVVTNEPILWSMDMP